MHSNKIHHAFNNEEHGFKILINQFGGKKELAREILKLLIVSNELPADGKLFKPIIIEINGYVIHAKGFMDGDTIKLGTLFIPALYPGKK